MKVTLSYSGDEVTREVPEGTTIQQLLDDPRNVAGLKYEKGGVEPRIGAVPQAGSTVIREGMRINLNDRACAKA